MSVHVIIIAGEFSAVLRFIARVPFFDPFHANPDLHETPLCASPLFRLLPPSSFPAMNRFPR